MANALNALKEALPGKNANDEKTLKPNWANRFSAVLANPNDRAALERFNRAMEDLMSASAALAGEALTEDVDQALLSEAERVDNLLALLDSALKQNKKADAAATAYVLERALQRLVSLFLRNRKSLRYSLTPAPILSCYLGIVDKDGRRKEIGWHTQALSIGYLKRASRSYARVKRKYKESQCRRLSGMFIFLHFSFFINLHTPIRIFPILLKNYAATTLEAPNNFSDIPLSILGCY